MFLGHYAPSFLAKALDKKIPLWSLFIAVQLVDIFWAIFILLGVEEMSLCPGITKASPLNLYYMPYSHSLVATFFWGLGGGLAYKLLFSSTRRAAVLVGMAVASHWFLDLIVHIPDLPLYGNEMKVGFGLWNYFLPSVLLEIVLTTLPLILYLKWTITVRPAGRSAAKILVVLMAVAQLQMQLGEPPASPQMAAVLALSCYFLFAAMMYWVERQRA